MVYNMQVWDTQEYFANNILVHNCVVANALACYGLIPVYASSSRPKTTPIREHYRSLVDALSDDYEEYVEY